MREFCEDVIITKRCAKNIIKKWFSEELPFTTDTTVCRKWRPRGDNSLELNNSCDLEIKSTIYMGAPAIISMFDVSPYSADRKFVSTWFFDKNWPEQGPLGLEVARDDKVIFCRKSEEPFESEINAKAVGIISAAYTECACNYLNISQRHCVIHEYPITDPSFVGNVSIDLYREEDTYRLRLNYSIETRVLIPKTTANILGSILTKYTKTRNDSWFNTLNW